MSQSYIHLAGILAGLFGVVITLVGAVPAQAAVGINQQVGFQGRLLSNTGAVIPDGDYNMRFRIYQDGDGVLGGGDETLKWTETRQNSASQGVTVKNGYFSVMLGSVNAFGASVDWNQSVLWLSMEVTTNGTDTGASPTWDGEMTPFRRLAANVYAMNAGSLGGLGSSNFVQLAQGVQADSSTTNASIFINKTGGTANILDLQRGGQDVMVINNAGQATFRPQTDSQTALKVMNQANTVTVMAVDTQNARVGIGTAAPAYALDVVGQVNVTGGLRVATNDTWITGVDSAGTGTVNIAKVNANNEIQFGASISVDGSILLPADAGQATLVDLPISTSTAAATPESYTMRVGSTNALTVYGESDGAGGAQNVRVAVGSSITPAYTLDVGGDINTSGVIRTGGTQRISNAGALSNVTADTGILTSGTLGVVRGGTGNATYTNTGVLYYNGTNFVSTAASTGNNQCLITATTGANPTWGSCTAGGGVTTVGAIQGTSTANGASITGNTLNLHVADGTNGGVVSTVAQTFAGNKTFSGNVITSTLTSSGALAIQSAADGNVAFTPNGTGDVVVNTDADTNLQVTATAAPAVDQLVVTNAGQLSTTSGVDGLVVSFGSSNASGDAIRVTPSFAGGATDALTYNALEVDAFSPTNAAGTDTVNGLKLGNLTDPGATITSIGLNIGTGWDSLISYNGTQLMNGTGILQSAAISGSYTNLTGTGALTAGSIGSGFGTISTGNNITTTAALQGNTLTVTNFNSAVATNGANTVLGVNTSALAQSPIAPYLWHDLLAFNKNGVPTFEQYNGSTWNAGTLNNALFDQHEAQQITVLDGTTTTGARWTWNGLSWSSGSWFAIGFTYTNPAANKSVLVESSADGSIWTTRHTSSGLTTVGAPVWFNVSSYGGDPYVRLTITSTNSQPVPLSTIRLLTSRWGDQGDGSELQYPYYWDSAQRMSIGAGSTPANGNLTIGTNTTAASGGLYFGTDVNLYRSAADTLKTDDNLEVTGTYNGNTFSGSALTFSAATSTTIQAANNQNLQLTSQGSGDVVVNTDADTNLQVTAGAAPQVDMVVVTNAGQLSTTSGVDGLVVAFGSSNASGDAIRVTPSFAGGVTDALTYNALEVEAFSPTNAAGTDTVNGLKLGNLTDPGATITSIGLNIGTGWDTAIRLQNAEYINNSTNGTIALGSDSGALTLSLANAATSATISNSTGNLILDSASNTLALAASDTTLQRTAAGQFTFDLNDAGTTTLAVTNSNGGGQANLSVEGAATVGTTLSTGIPGVYGTITALMQSADNFSSGLKIQKRGSAGSDANAVASGAELGYNEFDGWDGSIFGRGSYIIARTAEAWTGSAHGSTLAFAVTKSGTTTNSEVFTLANDGTATFAPNTNSYTAFVVQDTASLNVLTVDTIGKTVQLGEAGATGVNGKLAFQTATAGSYYTTIGTSGSQSANIDYVLPLSVPSASECLVASSVSAPAVNLGFASCGANSANRTLSNLTGPTAINTDLTFANGAGRTITVQTASSGAGDGLTIVSATGNGAGWGGSLTLQGGAGGTSGDGGGVSLMGGNGGGGNTAGGSVVISGGNKAGSGAPGNVIVKPYNSANDSATAFQIQNGAGTSMFTADTTNKIITTQDINVGQPSAVVAAGRQFSDGFETGNLNLWNGTTTTAGGGGTVTASTTVKRNGRYSARVATTAGAVIKETSMNVGTGSVAYARFYVYVPSASADNTNNMYFAGIMNSTWTEDIGRRASDGHLILNRGDAGNAIVDAGAFSLNAWHLIELRQAYNSGGILHLYLDGTQVVNLTANSSPSNFTSFYIGQMDNNNSTATYYIDDVSVDMDGTTGESASLNVNDSMHVAGTASFGSSALFQNAVNSTTALQIQNAAGTAMFTADTTNNRVTLRTGSDSATLGSELYPTNNFSTDWTNTGWTVSPTTQATHTTGNPNSLTNTTVTTTVGTTYQVSFALSGSCGPDTDAVMVTFGGNTLDNIDGNTCSGTLRYVTTATNTDKLSFSPTSTWGGTVSNVSIKTLSGGVNPVLVGQNASGLAVLEVRASSSSASTLIGVNSGSYATTSAWGNSAYGYNTLANNTTGYENVAMGYSALQGNTSGYYNVGVGDYALGANHTGIDNTAIGRNGLRYNTTGSSNTALGAAALYSTSTGTGNVGAGYGSGMQITTGSNNSFLGYNSGYFDQGLNFGQSQTVNNSTAIGAYAISQASNSIVLGSVDLATKVGIGTTIPLNPFSVSPVAYSTGTACQGADSNCNSNGTLVTGTGTSWTSDMVGKQFIFSNGATGTITAVSSATSLTLDTSQTVDDQNYRIHHLGLQVTSAGNVGVYGELNLAKRPDSGGTSADWTKISGAAGVPCVSGSTGVDSIKSVVYNGSLYIGTTDQDGAEVCRYDGGTTMTRINTSSTAGSFGAETAADSVGAMTVFDGKLYIATTGGNAGADSNRASVYRYDGGTTWTRINTTLGTINTTASINAITAMTVFNGSLWIGSNDGTSGVAEVYRYESGTTWTRTNATAGTFGGQAGVDGVSNLVAYNGSLYATLTEANAARLVRYGGGTTWVVENTTAGDFGDGGGAVTDEVNAAAVYNGALYLTTAEVGTLNRARLIKFYSGSSPGSFAKVNGTDGTLGGQTSIDKFTSLSVYNGCLYIGTSENDLAELFVYNGSSSFTRVSSATPGTMSASSITGINSVWSLVAYDDYLVVGTEDGSAGTEVFLFSRVEGQSQRLTFSASSDNAGSTEQAAYPNKASIFFNAEVASINNIQAAGTGQFIFSHGIATHAGAYDVAEDYPTRDTALQPGDLVSIDPAETGFVRRAIGVGDNGIVGVYSGNPALRLTQKDATIDGGQAVPVALAGRVPVRVSGENGPIHAGDPLTASSVPGVAMRATAPGRIVGMAMGNWTEEGEGRVTIFVSPDYYSGQPDLQGTSHADSLTIDGTLTTVDLEVTGMATIKDVTVTGTATMAKVTVSGQVVARSLVVVEDATIAKLTVTGETALGDVLVAGHFSTSGQAPVATVGSGAGKDATVSISGNDVSGTVTLVTGKDKLAAGEMVRLAFARAYVKPPHVVITPRGAEAALLQAFLTGATETDFGLGVAMAPLAEKTYQFEYFVIESQ